MAAKPIYAVPPPSRNAKLLAKQMKSNDPMNKIVDRLSITFKDTEDMRDIFGQEVADDPLSVM